MPIQNGFQHNKNESMLTGIQSGGHFSNRINMMNSNSHVISSRQSTRFRSKVAPHKPAMIQPTIQRDSVTTSLVPNKNLIILEPIADERIKSRVTQRKQLLQIINQQCLKCNSAPQDAVFLDCCHGGLCFSCASKTLLHQNIVARFCHICKKNVTYLARIHIDDRNQLQETQKKRSQRLLPTQLSQIVYQIDHIIAKIPDSDVNQAGNVETNLREQQLFINILELKVQPIQPILESQIQPASKLDLESNSPENTGDQNVNQQAKDSIFTQQELEDMQGLVLKETQNNLQSISRSYNQTRIETQLTDFEGKHEFKSLMPNSKISNQNDEVTGRFIVNNNKKQSQNFVHMSFEFNQLGSSMKEVDIKPQFRLTQKRPESARETYRLKSLIKMDEESQDLNDTKQNLVQILDSQNRPDSGEPISKNWQNQDLEPLQNINEQFNQKPSQQNKKYKKVIIHRKGKTQTQFNNLIKQQFSPQEIKLNKYDLDKSNLRQSHNSDRQANEIQIQALNKSNKKKVVIKRRVKARSPLKNIAEVKEENTYAESPDGTTQFNQILQEVLDEVQEIPFQQELQDADLEDEINRKFPSDLQFKNDKSFKSSLHSNSFKLNHDKTTQASFYNVSKNFTYQNSLQYVLNDTNPKNITMIMSMRIQNFDASQWTLTNGSNGFYMALGLGNQNFNDTDMILCTYQFYNKSTDNLKCVDATSLYPAINGPPSVGQLFYRTNETQNIFDDFALSQDIQKYIYGYGDIRNGNPEYSYIRTYWGVLDMIIKNETIIGNYSIINVIPKTLIFFVLLVTVTKIL
eukprot:403363275